MYRDFSLSLDTLKMFTSEDKTRLISKRCWVFVLGDKEKSPSTY